MSPEDKCEECIFTGEVCRECMESFKDCKECNGTGKFSESHGTQYREFFKCDECRGFGYIWNKKISREDYFSKLETV